MKCVLQCEMFTLNYPLLIEHILREAKLYRRYIEILEREGDLRGQTMFCGRQITICGCFGASALDMGVDRNV